MKTIKKIFLPALLLSTMAASAQQTETRKISSFNKLEIGGSFETVLQQGSAASVKITAENVDPQKVITKTDGSTLKIYLENGNYHNIRIKVLVTYTSLNAIDRSGSGNLTCESDLNSASDFDLSSNGSGNISIKGKINAASEVSISRDGSGNMTVEGLEASTIHMNFSGSGNFEVKNGNAKSQTIRLAGSGNVSAYGLKTETCSASISGSGDIEVYVNNSIDAEITGSGNIDYRGNAQIKSIEVHGSGRVDKKG